MYLTALNPRRATRVSNGAVPRTVNAFLQAMDGGGAAQCSAKLRRCAAVFVLVPLLVANFGLGECHAAGPWRADASNTAAWEAMAPAERVEHQRRMRGFRSFDDCAVYQAAQRKRLRERAGREAGALKEAPNDGCAQLRAQGQAR